MEKQVEKVYVKVNQVWQKGEAVSINDTTFKVKTSENQVFEIEKKSPYLEVQKFPEQRFAMGEVKDRLEGAYISFAKLEPSVQDGLVRGEEYLYRSTYIKEGVLKESVKMVQMVYSPTSGSRLDVQIKRNEPVTLGQAKAYNHEFTKEEFKIMVDQGKHLVFSGYTTDGEEFKKLAYYEPKLNDIRTKAALSPNMYFFGQQLTQDQADSMNKGDATKITINTKNGQKTYMVTYSPKAERFITKSLEKDKVKEIETKGAVIVGNEKKKKQPDQAMSL